MKVCPDQVDRMAESVPYTIESQVTETIPLGANARIAGVKVSAVKEQNNSKGFENKMCSATSYTNRHVMEYPIDQEMIIPLMIKGKSALALADSGSQTTITSGNLWKKIIPSPEVLSPPFPFVTGVGGNLTPVKGTVLTKMKWKWEQGNESNLSRVHSGIRRWHNKLGAGRSGLPGSGRWTD